MSYKILVVDDEKNILELISYNLKREGYTVVTADNGLDALQTAQDVKPDLIILDIMLPGKDGLEVCRQLRFNPETYNIPIIILSAKDEEIDKVVGLEVGADDYVTKPFSPRELLARIKAHLRRMAQRSSRAPREQEKSNSKDLMFGSLRIRPESYEVYLEDNKVELSPKEFEILVLLAGNPGRVFTRDNLLEKIWGFDSVRETRTVDVHIRYLRQKIEKDPANPKYIETVRGVGYRFSDK
ncbi:response regulator transcription factor [Desulfoscipio geothermicus]|uniref:Stage 0 sporulation protein A homolog n=1 Tax=Desulfoscipio geothermicus DSM 3669 TaxID=1121426 RepID=A0A1I6E7Q5_9FIRM|nr:response regulator transcription factor [Desulfoscipio geothermicus]SFR13581.1 two-component system, OmpR family, alkaline phosphatase synthesis response regulator PhoP [Desulfoscipio geothermicus DSM 3669]